MIGDASPMPIAAGVREPWPPVRRIIATAAKKKQAQKRIMDPSR